MALSDREMYIAKHGGIKSRTMVDAIPDPIERAAVDIEYTRIMRSFVEAKTPPDQNLAAVKALRLMADSLEQAIAEVDDEYGDADAWNRRAS